jgi:hypothetical protein
MGWYFVVLEKQAVLVFKTNLLNGYVVTEIIAVK